MRSLHFAGVLMALALPYAAHAADGQANQAAPASPWYSKLTLSGATDYNPRGLSMTNHQPAFETMLEVGYAYRLYGAIREINTNFGDTTREIDTAVGFRPVLSPFVLDFGLIHYDFNGTALPDWNELYGAFVWPTPGTPGQRWTVSTVGYWRIDNGDNYAQGDLGYVLASDAQGPKLVLSGRLAHEHGFGLDYWVYGGALTYTFLPGLTAEVRYNATSLPSGGCGGTLCDNRLMFKLSYATSMGAIFGGLHSY